jgi:hypothetical protein
MADHSHHDDGKAGHIPPPALEIILREHEHVSASLLGNRNKGTARFSLYVAVVGAALAFLGLKDTTKPDALSATGGFTFVIIFGWLMLITLIRRSITTDLHLEALENIRRHLIRAYGQISDAIPTLGKDFERPKLRYYKKMKCSVSDQTVYLAGHLIGNEPFPHYGDLVENICAINSIAAAVFVPWLIFHGFEHWSQAALIQILVLFLSMLAWSWYTQIMYVWYKHSTDNVKSDMAAASESVNEADLQERDQHRGSGEAYRRVRCFRRSVVALSSLSFVVLFIVNAFLALVACAVAT